MNFRNDTAYQIVSAKIETSLTGEDGSWTQIHGFNGRGENPDPNMAGVYNIGGTESWDIETDNQIKGRYYRMTTSEIGVYQAYLNEWSLFGYTLPPLKFDVTAERNINDLTITTSATTWSIEVDSLTTSPDQYLSLIKTELLKSDKITEIKEIPVIDGLSTGEVVGNASGDDFIITSSSSLFEEITNLPPQESALEVITLIQTTLGKSDLILIDKSDPNAHSEANSYITGNELILTGDVSGNDLNITINDYITIEELQPRESVQEVLLLIKSELEKSQRVTSAELQDMTL